MDSRTIRFLRSLALVTPLSGGLACEHAPEQKSAGNPPPIATIEPPAKASERCRCEDETYEGAPDAVCVAGMVDAKGKVCPHRYLPGGPLPPPELAEPARGPRQTEARG